MSDDVHFDAAELKKPKARDWLMRFAFGAGVSLIAAVVSKFAGPRPGGLFLAFPAILLASLTLVAKDDGSRQARNDARGATLGATGLIAFAGVGVLTVHSLPVWATLVVSTAAWGVVAFGGYLIARARGAGGDE